MSAVDGFWVSQVLNSQTGFFENLLTTKGFSSAPLSVDLGDDEFPILLPSVQMELAAESQMFFEEPWCNIDYEDRDAETLRLFKEYRQMITVLVGDDGIDMDVLFKLNRQTMFDEFPDVWDSSVAYELGEQVHLWIKEDYTAFLAVFQEDKELPIEVRFGRFDAHDMRVLARHMSQFSAAQPG